MIKEDNYKICHVNNAILNINTLDHCYYRRLNITNNIDIRSLKSEKTGLKLILNLKSISDFIAHQ